MKTCLSIAGSDSSGGAGIQADLKTFAALGVYGMSAITALTAQNTCGVQGVFAVEASFVGQQIQSVFDDIPPNAIKIGMLANEEIIEQVAKQLKQNQAENVVLDPVMIATSGAFLLNESACRTFIDVLIPRVQVLTPNVAELFALCHAQDIKTPSSQDIDYQQLALLSQALFHSLNKNIKAKPIAILSKGGHIHNEDARDYLLTYDGETWLNAPRINTQNTHGTGCTLSSAICVALAQGESLKNACINAKAYLTKALESGLNLGAGNGPLNHLV